jgi:hypothetical protein
MAEFCRPGSLCPAILISKPPLILRQAQDEDSLGGATRIHVVCLYHAQEIRELLPIFYTLLEYRNKRQLIKTYPGCVRDLILGGSCYVAKLSAFAAEAASAK